MFIILGKKHARHMKNEMLLLKVKPHLQEKNKIKLPVWFVLHFSMGQFAKILECPVKYQIIIWQP